ncbi:MAG: helix-turn-helix transcriptional regulator [Pleomorphochaeta sp.]
MKIDRLIQIVFILLNKDKISANELAKKFEVSKRTIYRDIETLSLAEFPIVTTNGKNGGISLMKNYKINSALFSNEEKKQIVYSLENFNINDEFLVNKVKAIFNEKTQQWIDINLNKWADSNKDLKFEIIKKAIFNNEILNISYYGANSKITQRDIIPLCLYFRQNCWYIYSFCNLKKDYRLFKLNRITNIKSTNTINYQIYDKKLNLDNEYITNDQIEIELLFNQSSAYRAFDEFNTKDITINADKTVSVKTKIIYDKWIYSFLASLLGQVKIIKPEYLKIELKDFLEKTIKNI